MVDTLKIRGNIIMVFMGLVFFVYIIRLFSIQVLSNEYKGQAHRNMVKTKIITPSRGNIYNRYGQIYVSNSPIFDLYVTPRELEVPDTNILMARLDMSLEEVNNRIQEAWRLKDAIFARYIEPDTYSALREETWNFQGLSFRANNKRFYRHPVGANILGYINEVDSAQIRESKQYYRMGDMVGRSGIERHYEEVLRGVKGTEVVLRDKYNQEVGSYAGGSKDKTPINGQDMMLGIDSHLQAFGEFLMQNKKGSIVAIEPATGDILAFVSAPTYNPNMLAGKDFRRNWLRLRRDSLKPLYNRPLMAAYPPGSIFKLAVGLAALNEGVITEHTFYSCGGAFYRNRGKPKCRGHITPLNYKDAVKYSCNSYFSATYMDFLNHMKFADIYESFNLWHDYMGSLGMGHVLNIDIPYEKSGLIPSTDMYDDEKRWYGKNRWKATTIISNAIGQGEILMTPLQMANMVTTIANRGYYIQPHFAKAIKDENGQWRREPYPTYQSPIAREHFQVTIEAMEEVVASGTARRAFIKDIPICGKTGTVQNPHGNDHAVFVGFAPKERPQIAIAVIIENVPTGGGGTWAAPVASLMIEQYLRKEIVEKEFEFKRITEADFIHKKKKKVLGPGITVTEGGVIHIQRPADESTELIHNLVPTAPEPDDDEVPPEN